MDEVGIEAAARDICDGGYPVQWNTLNDLGLKDLLWHGAGGAWKLFDGPATGGGASGRCAGRDGQLLNYAVWGNGSAALPDSGTRSAATTGQFRTLA